MNNLFLLECSAIQIFIYHISHNNWFLNVFLVAQLLAVICIIIRLAKFVCYIHGLWLAKLLKGGRRKEGFDIIFLNILSVFSQEPCNGA